MTEKLWKYPKEIPYTIEIPKISLYEMLVSSARHYADCTLCTFKGKGMNYSEVFANVNSLANGLKKLDIHKGDIVAVFMPNCPQFIISVFAVLATGAVVTTISPLSTQTEVTKQLINSEAKMVISLDMFLNRIRPEIEKTKVQTLIISSIADALSPVKSVLYRKVIGRENPKIDSSRTPCEYSYATVIKSNNSDFKPVKINPETDLAFLQYTGGTTGVAKGAMLTHYNLISQVVSIVYWPQWKPFDIEFGKEVIMGALPFSHIFGLTTSLLWGIHIGGKVVLVPDPRDLGEVLHEIDAHRATFFHAVPTLYAALANHPKIKEYDLTTLKACLSGGTSLPEPTCTAFEAVSNTTLVEGFGLTEASPVTHINPLNPKLRRIGYIGVPFLNTDSKVIDLDTGKDITEFQSDGLTKEGMLAVKGPQVMKGYWKNPEETAMVFTKDGWLKTGDIVRMAKDGFFKIVDRQKDMVNVSGYKVWPNEVESVLLALKEIKYAAVIPSPDARSGEAVKAFLVTKDGQKPPSLEEIRSFCKNKLAPYKIPHLIEYRESLPMSPVGKILRKELKEDEKKRIDSIADNPSTPQKIGVPIQSQGIKLDE